MTTYNLKLEKPPRSQCTFCEAWSELELYNPIRKEKVKVPICLECCKILQKVLNESLYISRNKTE